MAVAAADIKARALELGIDKIGIAAADALRPEGSRLHDWLDRGFHGQMGWMEREPDKRIDPTLAFAGARSVIVAAVNYYTDHEHSEGEGLGKISRYAWGDDYHDVLRDKLSALLDWMKQSDPNIEGKICIDTAPMMDKAWAARAGLGWIGKSTNLITTDLGSWVFLGEIIVNIELEYDRTAVDDHCGTCTACIDACPTGAIVDPYIVDARRCISYATIELRDEALPEQIEARLDGWLYGCDVCQDVCPWNRFEKPSTESRFEPRHNETSLALDDLAELEHEQYVERFRKSAVKRAKLSGLKRNAAALRRNCS